VWLAVEWVLMGAVLTAVYLSGLGDVPFHPDESQWIATSHYYEKFINGNIASPEWQAYPWTLTQPPLTRYAIAVGRLAGGFSANELNAPWLFRQEWETNVAEGRMPEPALLWWSRLPMAVTAVGCGVLLIFIARAIGGRLAGWVMLLLFVLTGYYGEQLRRAMGEALLLCLMLLAVLAAYAAGRSWPRLVQMEAMRGREWLRPLAWLLLLALFAGLAGAVKLNGLVLVGGGMVLTGLLAWKGRQRPFAWLFAVVGLIGLPLLAFWLFTAVNPAAYAHPWPHLVAMVEFRAEEIAKQQANAPYASLPLADVPKRIRVVPDSTLSYAVPWPGGAAVKVLMGLLALGGLGLMLALAWEWWRNGNLANGRAPDMSLAVLLMLGVVALPALLTPLDWDRYYLPLVVLASLGTAVCLAALSSRLWVQLTTRHPAGNSK
jgi:4-amino-4-deoxy-L-arabinose transferase-like glycosyltransferase